MPDPSLFVRPTQGFDHESGMMFSFNVAPADAD